MSFPFVDAVNQLVVAAEGNAQAGSFDVVNMVKSIEGFGIGIPQVRKGGPAAED